MLTAKYDDEFKLNKKTNTVSNKKIYFSGIITNVLNPKVALFFLAFLPQFVEQSHIESPLPFLILGLTFVATGTLWCLVLAFLSLKILFKIRENYRINKWLDRIMGGIFVMLGITLSLSKR